jgi:Putative Na+/H+ antiporter
VLWWGVRPALLIAAAFVAASSLPARALASAPERAEGSFPLALDAYAGDEDLPLSRQLWSRVQKEPLNGVATGLFLLAILHTFLAPRILAASHRLHDKGRESQGPVDADHDGVPDPPHNFKAEVLHFLGEVEAVFGIWVIPLLVVIAASKGWTTADAFLHGVNFTEAMFVVVIMAIASSRPVLEFAEKGIGLVASLGGRTPLAWWLSVLTVGSLLGSLITEPAAMIICALLLSRQVFDLEPRGVFRYATLGLLFVDISVGGTLTHFAAPPVLMVARTFGWGASDMLRLFGWKAAAGIVVSNLTYAIVFRRDFAELRRRAAALQLREQREPIPAGVTSVHLAFLGWTVLTAHTPALFVGGFLFFLAFAQATAPHQSEVNLRSPLLVGFFLAGLVVHGTLQQWWIAPILGRLAPLPLNLGAMVLTAFNDNAAITYLASLVPSLGDGARYAVVAGAVTGGGLTVIANAPNPAGQAVLRRYFPDGISPLGLLLGALVPTGILSCAFLLL